MSATLFLHAFGAAGRSWDAVRAQLPGAMRGHAPDLPGFGASAPLTPTDLDGYVGWIAQAIVGSAGPVVLVGHSMGGKLALRLAVRHADAVRALVLVGPTTPDPEPMEEEDRAEQLASHGDATAARVAVRKEARRLQPDDEARLVEDRVASSRTAWDWWLQRGSRIDITADLPRVRAPVSVVVGAQDERLGEAAQRLHLLPRLDPQTMLRVVPDCGHFVPVEQPAALAAAILERAS